MSLNNDRDKYAEELRKVVESVGANPIISPSSSMISTDWSDKIFFDQYAGHIVKLTPLDWNMKVEFGKAFIVWYLSGEHPDSESFHQLLIGMILCMESNGKNIFSTSFSADHGVAWTPARSQEFGVDRIDMKFAGSEGLNNLVELTVRKPASGTITSTEAKAFYEWVMENLNRELVAGGRVPEESVACINALSFLALTLIRASVKDPVSVETHIAETSHQRIINFWPHFRYTGLLPPPHAYCYAILKSKFARFTPSCNDIMTRLVYQFWKVPATDASQVKGILRAGCLLSLGEIGLGSLAWLSKASAALEITQVDLINLMSFKSIMGSLINIGNFCKTHHECVTWPWARMFQDEALMNLSVARNRLFSLICVGISVGGDPDSEIWKAPQIRHRGDGNDIIKEQALIFAQAIIEVVAQGKQSDPISAEAKEVEIIMKKKKESQARVVEETAPLNRGTTEAPEPPFDGVDL